MNSQQIILQLSNINILDCGDPTGSRFQVVAEEQHLDDADRCALVCLGSFYRREVAQLVVDALVCFQAQVSTKDGALPPDLRKPIDAILKDILTLPYTDVAARRRPR